ncbi:hypothetical protein PFISCL1PPCAC_16014, partial [Pristionchus fissidentatus]
LYLQMLSLLLSLPVVFASVGEEELLRLRRDLSAEDYASTFLNPRFSAPSVPAAREPVTPLQPGPILESGRFDAVSVKLLKNVHMPQLRSEASDVMPQYQMPTIPRDFAQRQPVHQPLYRYDGPLDGRKVWIYKKILRPVRITANGFERLPGAQVVEQWAEGGYGNELHTPVKTSIYAPTNNGFYTTGQFARAL